MRWEHEPRTKERTLTPSVAKPWEGRRALSHPMREGESSVALLQLLVHAEDPLFFVCIGTMNLPRIEDEDEDEAEEEEDGLWEDHQAELPTLLQPSERTPASVPVEDWKRVHPADPIP